MDRSPVAQADLNAPLSPPDGAQPLVTVVLPVLNGGGRLEHALEALRQQDLPRQNFEVIVADGRSHDNTVEIARSFGCRVVDNPGVTVAAGRNAGVRHARGELIAFSEDDITLPAHWLSSAVRLIKESGAGGVGGPTPIPARSSLWSHAVNAVFRLASRGGASVQSDRLSSGLVDDLPGGNSLYRAEALRAVGPIDERLTTAEDVAMHHELRRRGWELRACPELAAEHHKRDSVSGFFRQMQRFAIGRVQLWRRWSGALSKLHWLAAAIGLISPMALLLCTRELATAVIVLGLAPLAALFTGILVALRQGEQLKVALMFPVAMTVFLAGWTTGFWSELIVPSRDAKRIRLSEKLNDLLELPIESARPLCWLVGTLIALQCAMLAVFSQRAPFIMDEFQQGGYARHIDSGYYSAVVPFKTVLFTYLYYLPRIWIDSARDLLLVQRAETLALVLATLGTSYAISRELGRSSVEGGFVVTVTLGFSTFFEHACSLRAEPSALLMSMLALYAVVRAASRKSRGWNYLAAGIALGAAFFCTQKAIWFCVSIGLATVVGAFQSQSMASQTVLCTAVAAFKRSLLMASGFLVVGGLYCVSFSPATPEQVFRGVFLRSSQFALASSTSYHDMSQFIVQVFERSWWLFTICGAGLIFSTFRVLRDASVTICWLATVAMGAFVLGWKEPWPYTFTWWIPLLALFAPDALRVVSHRTSIRSARAARVAAFVTVFLAMGSTSPRAIEVLGWSNAHQLDMVDRVESLLAPGDFYQDGIGMVSTRPLSGLVWWDHAAVSRIYAELMRGENTELTRAFLDPPKVWILNYRIQNLWPALRPFLERAYVAVDGGLLVAGAKLRSDRPYVHVRWEGRYALVEENGRRSERRWSIDGREAAGSAIIARGPHQIVASGCQRCFILPDDIVGKVTPGAATAPTPLFDRPYTR